MKTTVVAALAAATLLCALPASAQPAPTPAPAPAAPPKRAAAQADLGGSSSDRPWAKGVPAGEQKIAIDLFREGNGLLKESLFVQAAAKYKEALSHWDHPGIHYNLALALLNLDQPVEVFLQLEEALKYGAAPLDADKFEHAGRYKALIEKQLARVEITCSTPGAQVTMDGRPLFNAPGRHEALVRVGQHTIVAQKAGLVTTQKTPVLPAGIKTTVDMQMYTAEELTHYKRRWHQAVPWSVLAAGVVLAGVGGVLHWQASEKFKEYDKGIAACAVGSMSGGCIPDTNLQGQRSSAEGLQQGAIAGYAIGGAGIVGGVVLAIMNRAKPYRVSPEADTKITIVPSLGPSGGGVVASIRF